jgi:type I restriction enzyme S subunit
MTSAGLYLSHTKERITKAGLNASSAWIVPPRAVLLSMYATIGEAVVNTIPTATNQAILGIIPKEDISPEFLAFCLRAHKAALSARNVQATQKNINKGIVETFPLPIPPFAEQRNIAAVLGLVQRVIEDQERLLALTAELKKALLHQIFTHGLHHEPQKQTDIGPVPESWKIIELGKVASLFGGYAFRSEDSVKSSNTQLVRMGNLYQNKLDLTRSPVFYPDEFAKNYARFVLHPGDLIMSLTGTSGKEDYGFTVEVEPGSKTLLLNQRIARIDLGSNRLTKEFLLYILLSRKFLDQLYPTAKGMKQANLSTHAMKALKIAIPRIDDQKEISTCFNTIDHKIKLHQIILDNFRDLFRTLLHQLMTAKIRVRSLNLPELESAVAA